MLSAVVVREGGSGLVRQYGKSRFDVVGVSEGGIKVAIGWKKLVRLRHQKHNMQAKGASPDIAGSVDPVVGGGMIEALILDAL